MMSDTVAAGSALLPIMIAQLGGGDPKYGLGAWLLVAVTCLAVMFNQLVTAWRNLSGRFQERDLPEDQKPRLRKDCLSMYTGVKNDMAAMREQSDRADTALRLEIKSDLAGVFNRINDVQKTVTKHTSEVMAAVARLDGKVSGKGPG